MKTFRSIFLTGLIVLSTLSYGQRGHGHHGNGHRRNVVVVHRSPFRPARVVVYHPAWHPAWSCARRWVFFPRYNLYWDNWRSHYVFWNGTIWMSQATAPPVIVNVNLANEKRYELKESDDDNDNIGQSNGDHKNEYKQ